MRRGPIQAELRNRLDDRSGREFPLWEKDTASSASVEPPWRSVDSLGTDEWRAVLQGARSVVAACTARHPAWMREALAWSSREARCRTYLFGAESWVSAPELQALMKTKGARLLTRLGSEPPADFLVADGERGWLVLGAPGAARRWLLPLAPGLARTLHEAFVHLFWHQARRESAPGGRFGECLPAPFPVPPGAVRPLARGQLVVRSARAEPLLPDAELVVEPRGVATHGTPRLLLTPPTGEGFAQLRERVAQGSAVAWFDGDLPRLALTPRRMVMELGEETNRLRLDFEAPEAIRMMHLLESRVRAGAWRFHPARALRDVRGPVRMEGAAAEQPVLDELPMKLEDVEAPELLTLDGVTPARWKEPPALTRGVRYEWRVLPPRAPTEARSARLLREWEQLDTNVEARARRAVEHLDRMEREEGERGLLTRLPALAGPWKGVRSQRERSRLSLDEIREQPLSRRPEDAPRLVALLAEQERALTELERSCRELEEREELRLAEETQRAAHPPDAKEPFRFQPPVRPAAPKRKDAPPKPVPLPAEPLPEVGALLEHGERRYLAVRTWEEASRAQSEAVRLNARLVAVERAEP